MSTLRISNIEAKADNSSPTVDEQLKFTNSTGDLMLYLDGRTSGITTVGINTTNQTIKFDANNNVLVTGIITATEFHGTLAVGTSVTYGDNEKAYFGNSQDLEIYHSSTGGESLIIDTGTGDLKIGGSPNVAIVNGANNQIKALFGDNAVSLNYAGTKKFETTNTGATVTGDMNITDGTGQSHYQVTQTDGNTVKFGIVSGSDVEISGSSNNNIVIKRAGSSRFTATSSGVIFGGTDFGFNTTPGGTPAGKAVFLAIGDSDTGIVQDGDGQLEIWGNAVEVAHFNAIDGYISTKPITTSNNMTMGGRLTHHGDTDTYMQYTDNQIDFVTGGSSRMYANNYAVYVQSGLPLAFLATSGATPNIKSGGTNNQDLLFTTGSGNPTRLQITSSGNIGIGTNNPVGNLEVRDTKANLIVAKDGLPVKSNSDLAASYDMIQLGAGGALASYSATSVTADTMFIHNAYRHSGNNWKRRYADTAARMRVNSPANTWIFETAATGSADSDITWAESLRIDSSGHMGLGITPSDIDSIGRALNIASSTGGAIYLQDTDSPTGKFAAISYNGGTAALQIHAHHGASYIDLGTNGTERLKIDSNGDVLINQPAEASGRLTIKGTNSNGSTAWAVSDSGKAREGLDITCTTVGDGNFGGAISFGCGGNGRSAIAARQYGSDDDVNGLSFFTHSSNNGSHNAEEKLRITSTGVVHHSNAADELTWSRQTGRASQGNGNSTTYSVKTFYYGIATFKIALSDGNAKWAHLVVEIGGMQYTAGNGYNATVVANSTGNGPSISLNKQDGGYHITITNGGNSNTLYGSWVLEGTSFTNGSTPTLETS